MARTKMSGGFTLIELLVVITIMSVLITLTLPSLRSARETAQVVRCLSNQRQIAVGAVGVYFSDHRGMVVPAAGFGPVGRVNNYVAWGLSSNFLVSSQGWSISIWELLAPDTYSSAQAPAALSSPMAYCPSDKAWWGGTNGNWREATYGLNVYLSYVKNGVLIHTRRDSINRGSQMALFIESHHTSAHGVRSGSAQVGPYFTYLMPPLFPSTRYISGSSSLVSLPRHDQGFTSSYVDGHAQFVKHGEVYEPNEFRLNLLGATTSTWVNYAGQPGSFYNAAFNATWAPYPEPWLP